MGRGVDSATGLSQGTLHSRAVCSTMVYSHDCGSKMSPTNSIVAASLHTNLVGELVQHKLIYRNVSRKFEGSIRSNTPGMWYITNTLNIHS